MISKTVKISEGNYRWLMEVAGKLQTEEKRNVSVDEALSVVKKKLKGKPSDLAGSWNITDEEVKAMEKGLRAVWKTWKIKYA